jgi:hypothetical protein
LAAETGLDPAVASALEESERRALAGVRAVVVTSHATAGALSHYGVGSDRVTVIEPGTDRAPIARGSAVRNPQSAIRDPQSAIRNPQSEMRSLLCVATLTPRKGHELLFRALALLRDRSWRLICAGSLDRDRGLVQRLQAQLAADGIADRVELAGDLDAAALAVEYDRADIFVLPTLYEGYGMAVAEALARGLPIVSTATGGICEMVADAAGIIVAPGDLEAFTAALARVLDDDDLRARLAEGARRERDRLPTWADAVRSMVGVLARGRHQHSDTEAPTPTPTTPPTRSPTPTPATGFSADWLALREPADAAARSDRLARAIADAFAPGAELRVLDLGAGTGANFRYLAPRLPSGQRWLLVDHDAALLGRAPDRVETRVRDLVELTDDRGADLFEGRALVTASALLDLVSPAWIAALVSRCRTAGAAVLFALNYDGRIECTPADPDDAAVRELVNQHQRTDKGFGWALGPDATDALARALAGHGYRIDRERSDWVLTPESGELQRQLIEGWAGAAAAIAPMRAASIDGWRRRRLAHLAAGRSHLVVGHEDLAGWLP